MAIGMPSSSIVVRKELRGFRPRMPTCRPTELPLALVLPLIWTPGTRRSASATLVAPLFWISSRLSSVRAPPKVWTLFSRPVPSQSPLTWIDSSVLAPAAGVAVRTT
ncbi:hypothetical protein D3C72_1687030 [compost metagenome]